MGRPPRVAGKAGTSARVRVLGWARRVRAAGWATWIGAVIAWGRWAGAAVGEPAVAEPSSTTADAQTVEAALPMPGLPSLDSLLWNFDVSVRTWAGYKDNAQLSTVNPRSSLLIAGGGDLVISRLPADGREFTVYAMLEHVDFVESGMQPETMGLVDVRGRQDVGGGWFVGGTAEYLHFRQVFDASDIAGVPAVLRAEGHMATLRPSVGSEWGPGWKLELEGDGSRQWLATPLDSYWDGAAKVVGTRELGKTGSLSLWYRFRERLFDERTKVDETGLATAGGLRFDQHETEAGWRRTWDAKKRWRSTLRMGWLENRDNGGGYYDYHRIQGVLGLRYVESKWELKAEVRPRRHWYPIQRVSGAGSEARRRFDLGWMARGQVTLWKGLRAFGQYEFDSSNENAVGADYHVNAFWLGLEYER